MDNTTNFLIFPHINKSIYDLLVSPEYRNYTDVVFSAIGQEIEKLFINQISKKNDVENSKKNSPVCPNFFNLELREKSKNSFTKNNSESSSPFVAYDTIGMKLVINNIPKNITISDDFKKKCKEKLFVIDDDLNKLTQEFSSHFLSKPAQIDINKKLDKIFKHREYLINCLNFNSILKRRNSILDSRSKNNNIKEQKNSVELVNATEGELILLDKIIYLIVGDYIINTIFKSKNLKSLGLYLYMPREKYIEENLGYNALHFCLKSHLLPDWIAELQVHSSFIETLTKIGSSSHDDMPGKQRSFTPPPDTKSKKLLQSYFKNLYKNVPKFSIFYPNGYIKKLTPCENVFKFFKDMINEKDIETIKSLFKITSQKPFFPCLSKETKSLFTKLSNNNIHNNDDLLK